MANLPSKEPDFYPFRLKDHGWVLKRDASIEDIGEAFRDIVYQLVSKDFTKGSVAEAMYNDALSMMNANSERSRNAANVRWGNKAIPLPKNINEVLDFAHENNLADDEWVNWWANENLRKGKGTLPDGTRILNWRKQLIKAFKTKEKKDD